MFEANPNKELSTLNLENAHLEGQIQKFTAPGSLRVRHLDIEEYSELKRLMDIWEKHAIEMKEREEDAQRRQRLEDGAYIAGLLRDGVLDNTTDSSDELMYDGPTETFREVNSKILICENVHDGSIQGVLHYQLEPGPESLLNIRHLITNPANLTKTNSKGASLQIRGIGTLLLNRAVKIAFHERVSEVLVFSLNSSTGFYFKYGFSSRSFLALKLTLDVNEAMQRKLARQELIAI